MSNKNMCRPSRLISYCSAEKENVEECKYYKKATRYDRCMYSRNDIISRLGEPNCSCVDAQWEARAEQRQSEKTEEELLIESQEGEIPT